jgi:hypothetical protein
MRNNPPRFTDGALELYCYMVQSCADNLSSPEFRQQTGSRGPEVSFGDTVLKVILDQMLFPACRNSRDDKLSALDCNPGWASGERSLESMLVVDYYCST